MIRSPEVVNQVTIKKFDHFPNHGRFYVDEKCLLGNSLFQLENQRWKDMRSSLSPAFTGSKMRGMFELIRDIGKETVEYLKTSHVQDLDLKDFLCRYANDVIATTAFGFKMNSNKDQDSEFYRMGNEATDFSYLKFFFISNFMELSRLLKLELIPKKHREYYMNLVLDAMKYRKHHSIIRHDMINMLMEMKDNTQHNWTDVELVSQCFLFFIAAFEMVSSTLSFICHELMENQDCQDKLRKEINQVIDSLDGQSVSYEAINSMKYSEAVIFETMRKWPAAPDLDRICSKPTTLYDPITGKDVLIQKGDRVQINVIGIQRDPKYFPDPMKFDPEKFMGENRKKIDPNTILAFGIGPRMCIGNRFAILEIKSLMFHLFKEFKLVRHEKSTVPLTKLDTTSMGFEPKGGFFIKFEEI